ncbi:hypothetical protein CAOG_010164 [Capsaspora owczarzaki ATCC 30864]|uniref:phosphoinositide phospholipase C n=1 Tax=Capsaspora owczarzaki (strain ATCC 30864) TaxID=595528 RepID=A0A0D2USE2_CAPO3|nr:hypothetical protein CAOG_010164 [Capsaspora owczarzaki ATCC 30864]
MQLNAARFAQNGNAGYVLKPEILRKPAAAKGGLEISKLKIQLVHGFQLNAPKSNNRMSRRRDRDLSPIVEVEVVGLKTLLLASASAKGGELPEWNDTFEFDVSMPDIALVRFNVFDDKTKESLGAYALPVSSLLPGFRRIPLNKYKPFAVVENTPASLFINVSFA